jgi:outer membrane lipoprotein-sorting protein
MMREIQDFPVLTAISHRIPIVRGFVLFLIICFAFSGCSIKRKVAIEVSPKIIAAKNASFDELLGVIRNYDKILDLSCRMKVTLTYGKWESGQQEEYKGAPGYILLRKPDSLHLVVQNPITHTAIFDVLSVGDDFFAWIPSKVKFYRGKNSARELVAEDLPGGIPLRASHIFEAITPQIPEVDSKELRISVDEVADKIAKYYILSVYKEGIPPRIHTIRRIWIERSQLALSRQQIFGANGQMLSDIEYLGIVPIEGFFLPVGITMNRPEDGYALKMEFRGESWKINKGLKDDGFVLSPPNGAEIIYLKDKQQGATP